MIRKKSLGMCVTSRLNNTAETYLTTTDPITISLKNRISINNVGYSCQDMSSFSCVFATFHEYRYFSHTRNVFKSGCASDGRSNKQQYLDVLVYVNLF